LRHLYEAGLVITFNYRVRNLAVDAKGVLCTGALAQDTCAHGTWNADFAKEKKKKFVSLGAAVNGFSLVTL
jgi:hypothetical protein